VVYEKLCSALTNNSLVKGIKQASPFAQTSCLEGFHSLLNQFAPKMVAYSYAGMYCRHILAVVHFNFNLQREVKKNADGVEGVKVSYPKFKNGEATVRNARITQNFDYVEEIFQTYLMASKDEISDAANKLREMTPAPMNSMLEKQPKEDAIKKRDKRRSIVVTDVPPTTPVPQPSTSMTTNSSRPNKRTHPNEASSSSRPRKKPRTSASSPTPRTEKGPRTSRPGKRAQGSKPSTSRRQGKKSRTSKS